MHDYQLERLNTRSFEQLVQALGLAVIGKQLMIFGDGPDGGREATFQGQTKYPEGAKQWNGYGIVQAKFRQQPDSLAKKNGDWAIAQLKAEFSKLKARSKQKKSTIHGERICPEYYVFATNLALSPVAKTGGKDRVRALLDGFKESHGLKDYAVWDGDQIRRFLDSHPSIRTTYAAWLLPGDVLAEMMEQLKLTKTDFSSTIRRYLEVELLDDQFAKLGQGGYTDANAIPLSKVFVDLPVDVGVEWQEQQDELDEFENAISGLTKVKTADGKRPTFLDLFLEEGRQVLKPSANPRPTSDELLARRTAGRVVLIGGPGQGKTTVGQFTCQLLRAAILKVTCANYSPEIEHALKCIEKQSRDLPAVHVLRYPLRIDLKKLAEALAGEGDFAANSVLDYIVRHVSKRTDSELSKQEFRTWLQSYPWLLVLDGLDEVPASSNRTKMMDAIRDFVSVEAHHQDADLLILATTRPQGYSDEFDPGLYSHLPLAPLNSTEALEYGTKLAHARHPGLKSRVEELSKSLKRATTNPATVRLMESPLQVTIMLALIEGGGEPPEQRWKLFHDYYDVIYRREKERGTPFSALLGKYEPDIHWLHHRAGWILQQRNATAGATAAKLSHVEFEGIVDSRLIKRGHSDASLREVLVTKIREAATDRLVFLVGNTSKEIGFEIRSLQEFMAAEHCFDGPESCVHETVRTIAPHAYWRNVFLFVAGRIFFEKESLIDSLIAVCERLNETFTDQGYGVTVAGSRLALAMLRDGVSRNQPENSRVLARCAVRLLDAMVSDEASELVALFTSEASDVWEEELSKRLRQTEADFAHVPWRVCLELVGAGNEFAMEIMRTRFPWKHCEIGSFLAGVGSDHRIIPKEFWILFKDHIFSHSPGIWRVFENEKLPEVLDSAPLSEFIRIFRHDRGKGVTLLDEAGRKTCNALRNRGAELVEIWAGVMCPTTDVGGIHPTWRTCQAIAEFARNYTLSGLAEQLSVMFANDPLLENETLAFDIPWQVGACLIAKRSGIPASHIIDSVISGSLGNADDWARWESLNTNGIKISTLGLPDGVLSITNEHKGALFTDGGWHHTGGGSPSDFEFANALTDALPSLRADSDVVETMVSVCCFGINSADSNWSPENAATVERFVMCCKELSIPIGREIIVAVVRSSIDVRSKLHLLALIGVNVSRRSWVEMRGKRAAEIDAGCREIVEAISESASLVDVFGAISFLPPLPFAKMIPLAAIKLCRQYDELHQQAADILYINGFSWVETGEQIAAQVMKLQSRYPRHLGEMFQFIDSQGMSNAKLESFLVALINSPQLQLRPSKLAQRMELLIKLVDRRPTIDSLPDPSVFSAASSRSRTFPQ